MSGTDDRVSRASRTWGPPRPLSSRGNHERQIERPRRLPHMKLEGSADAGGVGRCEYKGVGFEVPPGWADESIFKATAPSSGGSAQSTPSVIMTRRARLDGETVATHIEQQILELCRL